MDPCFSERSYGGSAGQGLTRFVKIALHPRRCSFREAKFPPLV